MAPSTGPHVGEPLELTLLLGSGSGWIKDQIGQFQRTMKSWGLPINVETSRDDQHRSDKRSDFTLTASRWGGGIPKRAMDLNFSTEPKWPSRSPRLPPTTEAPPLGDPWPTADELEPYDMGSMADELVTATDDTRYQDLVDRLTWVYNQTAPRIGVEFHAREWAFNVNRFDLQLPREHPELWTRRLPNRVATTGIIEYRPPNDR